MSDESEDVERRLREMLRELGFETRTAGGLEFEIPINGEQCSTLLVPLAMGVVMLCYLPWRADSRSFSSLAYALHVINDRLPYGSFELSSKTYAISYKVSSFMDGSIPSKKMVKRCVAAIVATVEQYGVSIKKVYEGVVSPEDVIKFTESNAED